MKKFDVIVIGAGSGLEISAYAAEQGLTVAVVEQGPFGGTCLNKGCIPSKMLIHSADVAETIQESHLFGITSKITKINWQQLINRVNNFVDTEAQGIEQGNRQTNNITVYKTTAKFTGHKLLDIGNDTITADKIFIAAGTRPSIPNIEGLDKTQFITSDDALRLKKQPKQLIIIGGGYIAAELAHFFGSLGTKVTIIQRGQLLLSNEDKEISQKFTQICQQKHQVLLETTTNKVYSKGKKIFAEVTEKGVNKKISCDTLLIA
ncbi:FAD-dependent oxidoreductase, partial [Candidatus Woesearchaeota archaeon]|nr:FAD-dependent oxidoreductase [Candidatus Woesearchaeota archaeon]